jgi:hypothetical protein
MKEFGMIKHMLKVVLRHVTIFTGTVSYSLNQTGLGNEYFGVQSNGDLYVTNGLTSFSSGSTLTISAFARDSGGLQGE